MIKSVWKWLHCCSVVTGPLRGSFAELSASGEEEPLESWKHGLEYLPLCVCVCVHKRQTERERQRDRQRQTETERLIFLLREATFESKSFECRVSWGYTFLMGIIAGFRFGQKRALPTSQGALWKPEAGSLGETPSYTLCPSVWTHALALLLDVQISQEMLIRTNLVDRKAASGWVVGTGGCLARVVLGFWVRDGTRDPWAGESIQAALVGRLYRLHAPVVDLWACGLHRNCLLDVSTQSKGFSLTRAVASDQGDGMEGD